MINNIQILRGLAALWVFFHHSLSDFKIMGLSFLPFEWLASYGYMGVDVFFVISGLVMAKTTEHMALGWDSGKTFLIKRFFRIYLGYWPILILMLLLIWYFNDTNLQKLDLWGSVLLLNTNMFELIIAPAWSLPFELYFYSLITVILLFKITKVHWFFLVLSCMVILKLNVMDFGVSKFIDLVLSHMIFEFLFGYYLWHFRHFLLKTNALFFIAVAVAAFFFGAYYELVNTVWRPLVFGLFAAAIIALAMKTEGKIYSGLVKLLKPIGDASYTLYLLHFVLLYIFYNCGARTWLIEHNYAVLGFISLILIVIFLSYTLYLIMEKPLYQFATRRTVKKDIS